MTASTESWEHTYIHSLQGHTLTQMENGSPFQSHRLYNFKFD